MAVEIELSGQTEVRRMIAGLLDEQHIDAVMGAVVQHARDVWVETAEARLTTSRGLYVAAIGQPTKLGNGHWALNFVGQDANVAAMIEFGNDSWDMKEGRKGQVIAFRTRPRTAPGQRVPMQTRDLAIVGRPYAAALGGTKQANAYGRTVQGLLAAGVDRGGELALRAKPGHQRGLYEGARSLGATGGYVTFRTIGDDGWIYPARPRGVDLLATVERKVNVALPEIVGNVINSLMPALPPGGSHD